MPLFGLTFHRLSRPPPSALTCPPIALMGMACGLRRRCGLCSGVAPVVCWCMHRASRCGTAAGRAERFANRLGEASGAAWLGRSHRPHPSWRPGDSFFRRPSPLVVSISFYQRARHTTKGLGSSFYSRLSLCPTQGVLRLSCFLWSPRAALLLVARVACVAMLDSTGGCCGAHLPARGFGFFARKSSGVEWCRGLIAPGARRQGVPCRSCRASTGGFPASCSKLWVFKLRSIRNFGIKIKTQVYNRRQQNQTKPNKS